jgi:hypothetical protein
LDVTLFHKEIRDEVYLYTFENASPKPYITFTNGDFGNVKGVSFDFQLQRTNRIAANMNYTLQWANGTGSDPYSQFSIVLYNPTERPTYVAPLNFDQRHTASLNLDFKTLPKDGPRIFNRWPFGETDINLLYAFGSGFAYTPELAGSSIFSGRSMNPTAAVNSAHWKPSSCLNLRIDKTIRAGQLILKPYLWVINLLNNENYSGVYASTGLPGDDGYFSTPEGIAWAKANPKAYQWYRYNVADPTNWEEPRQIRVGLRIDYQ